MDSSKAWLLALHVTANLVWIGSIVAAGFLLGPQPAVARGIYRRFSNPAFYVSLLCGGLVIALDPGLMKQHYMHLKLTVAFIVVGLTHAIGARARRRSEAASGPSGGDAGQKDAVGANLTVALLVCAFLAVAAVLPLKALIP